MNKKNVKQWLRAVAYGCMGLIALSACTKKDVVDPGNEVHNKLHEDPVKAVFTLTEAHLEAGKELSRANLDGIRLGQNKQVITYKQDQGSGFSRTKESVQEFRVKTTKQDPSVVYFLDIKYYNINDQEMNYQFIENGQDNIHQHFFTTYQGGLLVRDASKIPYLYVYADRDKQGKLFPENNPIGMQGYFQFRAGLGEQDIKFELTHFFRSKYNADGTTSPYYAPDRANKTLSDADVSLRMHFVEVTQ